MIAHQAHKQLLFVALFFFSHSIHAMYSDFCMGKQSMGIPKKKGYVEVVANRIKQNLKGKDLIKNCEGDNRGLLARLAYEDDLEGIEKIVEHDPSVIDSEDADEAMHTSVFIVNVKILKYFLDKGGDVNTKKNYDTLLHPESLSQDSAKIFNIKLLLLINNANPNKRNGFGKTALTAILTNPNHTYQDINETFQDILHKHIVSGADPFIKTFNNLESGSKNNEKDAIEIANMHEMYTKLNLAKFMQTTAQQRDNLFAAVANGDNIDFKNTEKNPHYISRRHVRDVKGNSLLYYALQHGNIPVATKLLKLWPQLIIQPNFDDQRVLDLIPEQLKDIMDILYNEK